MSIVEQSNRRANLLAGHLKRDALISRVKDQQHLVDLLKDIERRFDVNALAIGNLRLWPLVRLELGRNFKLADATESLANEKSDDSSSIASQEGRKSVPRSQSERDRLIKDHLRMRQENLAASSERVAQDWKKVEAISRPSFAVLTRISNYFIEKDGGYYSPIIDPVIQDLDRFGRVASLGAEPLPFRCLHEPLRIDEWAFRAPVSLGPIDLPTGVAKMLGEVEEYLAQNSPEFELDVSHLTRRLASLRLGRRFYFELFDRLKPEFLVVSSFTSWLGALWAAKDLSIPVIDVQHGGEGRVYYPTTHFTCVPPEGYHFLPDVLWLWGEQNREFVSPWLPGRAKRHIPVVGGHRGIARWIADRSAGRLSEKERDFLQRFDGRPNALVTLSYAVDPLMPEALVSAVAATPELSWLIRLHPIHRSGDTRDALVKLLNALGCNNFAIDEPTELELQTVLSVSRVHFTPFSSAVREAVAVGVPTAVVHPIGERLFQEEIESGVVTYATSVEAIASFARSHAADGRRSGLGAGAIETSEAAMADVVAAATRVRSDAPPLMTVADCNRQLDDALDQVEKLNVSKRSLEGKVARLQKRAEENYKIVRQRFDERVAALRGEFEERFLALENKTEKPLILLLAFEDLSTGVMDSVVFEHARHLAEVGAARFEIWFFSSRAGRHGLVKERLEVARQAAGCPIRVYRAMRPALPFSIAANGLRLRRLLAAHVRGPIAIHARNDYACAVAGWAVAKRIPVLWDCRGNCVAEALERLKARGKIPYVVHRLKAFQESRFQNAAAAACDAAIFLSSELKRIFAGRLAGKPMKVAHSVASEDLFYWDPELRVKVRQELGYCDDDVIYVFNGSLAHYQRFDLVVAKFRDLVECDPRSKLLVLTLDADGARRATSAFGPGTVRVISADHKAVNRYLNAADVAFMLRDKNAMNAVSLPTKFAEYCLTGLPIIMNDAVHDAFVIARQLGNIWSPEEMEGRTQADRAKVAESAKELVGRKASTKQYRWIYGELMRRPAHIIDMDRGTAGSMSGTTKLAK